MVNKLFKEKLKAYTAYNKQVLTNDKKYEIGDIDRTINNNHKNF